MIENFVNLQNGDHFKQTPNRQRIFIELYDQAIFMRNYRFKDPTSDGREFFVDILM